MRCDTKLMFRQKKDGKKRLDAYNRSFDSIKNGNMSTYYCNHHQRWHMGHQKDYSNNRYFRIDQILKNNQPSRSR